MVELNEGDGILLLPGCQVWVSPALFLLSRAGGCQPRGGQKVARVCDVLCGLGGRWRSLWLCVWNFCLAARLGFVETVLLSDGLMERQKLSGGLADRRMRLFADAM